MENIEIQKCTKVFIQNILIFHKSRENAVAWKINLFKTQLQSYNTAQTYYIFRNFLAIS